MWGHFCRVCLGHFVLLWCHSLWLQGSFKGLREGKQGPSFWCAFLIVKENVLKSYHSQPPTASAGLRVHPGDRRDPKFLEVQRIKDQERGGWLHCHLLGSLLWLHICSSEPRLVRFNPFIAWKGRSREVKNTAQVLEQVSESRQGPGAWASFFLF